ncbi:MAG: hypothetical protein HYU78_11415 [Rhodocyclales bacterium]|nr:hypothetical protein [Rhodocyclales bacterium]
MRSAQNLFLTFMLLLSASPALASQEGALSLNSFQFSSLGISESGPVNLSGEKNHEVFVSLSVSAFGRTINLSKEQLAKLRPAFINGVSLSYEAGYKNLGGRTLYVIFTKSFTSGTQESQIVSINEQGVVEVSNVSQR